MQTDHPDEPDYRTQNSMGWDMDFRTSEQLELADTRKNDVGKYKQKEEKKELKPTKEKRESGLRSSFCGKERERNRYGILLAIMNRKKKRQYLWWQNPCRIFMQEKLFVFQNLPFRESGNLYISVMG